MRDEEQVRRSQAGVLLGLGVGTLACPVVWLALVLLERSTGWVAPWHASAVAGACALVAMLLAVRCGAR